MNRNSETKALIISLKQSGENNRIVTMFTPDQGIITAVLYGGPKSKLRTLVSPFHTGRIWLYTDPQRKSTKITDFDVYSFRPTLRENLYKSWAASLCCELLVKTHAQGQDVFTLSNGFLDGLDLSSEEECKLGTVRFLWRYQIELGIEPDLEKCCFCSSIFTEKDIITYNNKENGFMCPICKMQYSESEAKSTQFILSEESRQYLTSINTLSPKDVRSIVVSEKTFLELKNLMFYLTEKACDGKLKTLDNLII